VSTLTLVDAIAAVGTISEGSLIEFCKFAKPPQAALLTFQAVMVCFDEATALDNIRKVISKPKDFIRRVQDYTVDACVAHVHKLRPLLDNPELTIHKAECSHSAAGVLLKWVHALAAAAATKP
jgi:hypothetical protein